MRSILPAALALLAACAGPSQSAGGDPPPTSTQPAPAADGARQVSVEVVQGTGRSSGDGEQQATAEGGGGTVAIRGVATTPTPCHKLTGTVERSGGQVTVRISAAADPEVMCIASIGAVPYTATVRGLAAGSYDLRVEHAYPGTGWETAAVLQTRVTVR
jgi:hypothetical protein